MTGPRFDFQDLGMLTTIGRAIHAARNAKAANLIRKAEPGQSLEDAGISPEDFKRLYGRLPKPGETIKPATPLSTISKAFMDKYSSLDPQLQDQLTTALGLSTVGATATGRDTKASLKLEGGTKLSQAQTADTIQTKTAPTQIQTGIVSADTELQKGLAQKASMEGLRVGAEQGRDTMNRLVASLDPKDQQTAADVGFQGVFGTTPMGMQAKRYESQLSATANKMTVELFGDKAMQDPKHPFRKIANTLGIPVEGLVGLIAANGLSALSSYSQVAYNKSANPETEIAKEEARWAGIVGLATGIKPTEVTGLYDRLRIQDQFPAGEVPDKYKIPEHLKSAAAMIRARSKMMFQASMAESGDKSSPLKTMVEGYAQIAGKFKDPAVQVELSNVIKKAMAQQILTTQGNPPPGAGDDKEYVRRYNLLLDATIKSLVGIKEGSWWGMNPVRPDMTGTKPDTTSGKTTGPGGSSGSWGTGTVTPNLLTKPDVSKNTGVNSPEVLARTFLEMTGYGTPPAVQPTPIKKP